MAHPAALRLARFVAGAAIVFVLSVPATIPASAQNADMQQLFNRLSRLERDLQTLAVEVYRGEAPAGAASGAAAGLAGDYATQVEVRLSELERQIQLLTGRVEELNFASQQGSERLDRALADIEFRLSELEGGTSTSGALDAAPATGADVAASGAASGAAAGAVVGATVDPTGNSAEGSGTVPTEGTLGTLTMETAEEPAGAAVATAAPPPDAAQTGVEPVSLPAGPADAQYDYAYNLLAQGDYGRAEQALAQFLQANPESPLASNAQYWLGETYYIRGQFNEAAVAFAQGYQRFPDGAKAVDSLLKLGMSLSAMDQRDDACLTFSQLRSEFPSAPTGITRRAEQEQDRLQCS